MPVNKGLHAARQGRNDDFYTRIEDVEAEMAYHADQFRGMSVLCNCDDPTRSAFWAYFHGNFARLGLARVVATYLDPSQPVRAMEYTGGCDGNLMAGRVFTVSGDGDFRGRGCLDLFDQCDAVVTNPPFSLFHPYMDMLLRSGKMFLVLGNLNAVTYKDVFPWIMDGKLWTGPSVTSGGMRFHVPDGYPLDADGCGIDGTGRRFIRVKGVRWFTNLDYPGRHERFVTKTPYVPGAYRRYDNYDAINVDAVADIPYGYDGVMGVPITFVDHWCPEQFEILGLAQKAGMGLCSTADYRDYAETRQDGTLTGRSGAKINGNPVLAGRPERGNFFVGPGGRVVRSLYSRMFIRLRS